MIIMDFMSQEYEKSDKNKKDKWKQRRYQMKDTVEMIIFWGMREEYGIICEDKGRKMSRVKKGTQSDEDYQQSDQQESEFEAEIEQESESSERKVRNRKVNSGFSHSDNRGDRPRRQAISSRVFKESSEDESQVEEDIEEEESVFMPEIEQILSRRITEEGIEYYLKFKNHSYMWCEWWNDSKIIEIDKSGRQKINRFNRIYEKKLLEMDPDEINNQPLFDQSFIEIDRIINTTEMFPIIHPKKANEIKSKWNEYLAVIVSKLLNFTIGKIKYGIYFMQPVNPESEGCSDYRRIIQQPMDLGTIYNRLHLDYYKLSKQFWYELGLVFKNCRRYTPDPQCELRILCDTLGEVTVQLYKQWYTYQSEKYSQFKQMAIEQQNQNGNSDDQNKDKMRILLSERQNYTQDLELWNPGEFSFEWFIDEQDYQPTSLYITDLEIDLMSQHKQLYLIKWKNLSYLSATWEFIEELSHSQQKLIEFRQFNRSMDKDTRSMQIKNSQRHRIIMDYEMKKKNKVSMSEINELKSQLYLLEIGRNRKPFQYTPRTQTIYKDRKLLRDYQLDSLNWMIDAFYNNRNVLLADEMGLGKTIQSIAFLNHLFTIEQCRGPFLIIAPLSTLQHWKRSCEDWTNLNAVLYYDSQGQAGRKAIRDFEWNYTDISMKGNILVNQDLFKFQILITSYEVFNQDQAQIFQHIPFQFIIVDEAHRLKNQKAKILSTLKKLICPRVMILTGTPVQNNSDELWSLLNFIEPTVFPSLNAFVREFGELNSIEQIEKLNKTLKPFILRRQKEDVEQSIPPLQENIIDVELTNIQKTLYRALYERNKQALIQGFSQQTAQIATLNNLDMHLRKLCNHPLLLKEMHNEMVAKLQNESGEFQKILIEWSGKMVLLDKMLEKFLKEQKKVLIFSQFTNMLSLLEDYLKFNQIKYEKITGDIKQMDRQNAIDRFNDLDKGRQVFLLSTKAGGQGINLTAAEIVVIFDSDWNPQNDIQATARAHRIGQDKQVAVYRLITKNTYESKMFERAVAKLGLDQAIFMGGEFTSANLEAANNHVPTNQKKISKKELEILLKQGSLGLLDQSGLDVQNLNIDDVLNNTRVAKYSLVNGSYTISKQTFVPEQSTLKINIDDPNFWQVVLKNQETKSQKLLKLIKDDENIKTIAQQHQIMSDLAECINQLIETKISMEGYDADEEMNLNDILNMIGFNKLFDKCYKDLVNTWIEEMQRPSRRCKKIILPSIDQVTINSFKQIEPRSSQQNINQEQQIQQEFNWSDFEEYKKLLTKTPQELQVRLCGRCEKPRCHYFCRGFCKRQYHGSCIGLEDLEEPNIKYLCQDCEKFQGTCFVCQKTGTYYPNKTKKKQLEQDQEFLDYQYDEQQQEYVFQSGKRTTRSKSYKNQNDLVKCAVPNCAKLYHFACVETSRNFRILDGISQKFKCALHQCEKCNNKNNEEGQNIYQCLRCPRSYHAKCAPKGITKKTKKYILCPLHKDDTIQQPMIRKKVRTEQRKQQEQQLLEDEM